MHKISRRGIREVCIVSRENGVCSCAVSANLHRRAGRRMGSRRRRGARFPGGGAAQGFQAEARRKVSRRLRPG